jgi:hypothetical protein
MLRRSALLLATVAVVVAAPTAASASARSCPAERGTLAHDRFGRVWHAGHSLYACTTVYGRAPRARRLGPYATGTKVAWDGSSAAWSVPLTRHGVRSDRAWVASAEDGKRWLLGTRLVPTTTTTTTPAAEARIQRLFVFGESAGWVTRDGSVVLAVHSPQDTPQAFGTLPTPPHADHKLVLVGAWPTTAAASLATTVQLGAFDGDGDECGGSETYRLTVAPEDATRIGVTWTGGWERPFCG